MLTAVGEEQDPLTGLSRLPVCSTQLCATTSQTATSRGSQGRMEQEVGRGTAHSDCRLGTPGGLPGGGALSEGRRCGRGWEGRPSSPSPPPLNC